MAVGWAPRSRMSSAADTTIRSRGLTMCDDLRPSDYVCHLT